MGNPDKDPGGQCQVDCSTPTPDSMNQGFLCNLPVPLTLEEKKYLLAVERGDLSNVRRMLQRAFRKRHINVNCVDSFGRGALTLAIDAENLEMVELLVVMGVDTRDALLQAINAEFVEAVELLLEHEELIHKEGEPYSWQKVEITTSMFTPDITPLVLAAHKNNYEILKILLDRGCTLPAPHDIKCGCDECIKQSSEDSLRHSLTRVNQYRALASPSLIALSSNDPLLTAFQLSWDLRNLAFTEQECKHQYLELRRQCQKFAVDLLDQTRTSQELAIILNHDPDAPPYMDGEHMSLARLEAAIDYKQKKFVAHPNIQQLLAALWYEGVPGFRRKAALQKMMICVKVAVLFPLYCALYMISPNCETSKIMRKPFMKFLIHASSYLFFLFILILVSQRAEIQLALILGTASMKQAAQEQMLIQRGSGPTPLELLLVLYVIGFIWEEIQEIHFEGIRNYLRNMWNFIDFSRNSLYCMVILLRVIAYFQQAKEIKMDPNAAYIAREHWNDFDPQLIAEGLFAAANVFSALKLVHLFSINPHLGPLQISLGRMVIDIVKFFFIYSLVLFAFACGLNQLLWYFADLEKQKCYSLPNGLADWDNQGDACMKWRRFGNLFESSQSLFWASFGMVGLEAFELSGIKSYTRFWGLLMFGSYSVINVIVLLNLLIAMMSNSYAAIEEASDTEWKFARTKLWLNYFEEGATLPPPFNIFPTMKNLQNLCGRKKRRDIKRRTRLAKRKFEKERELRYTSVMRALVWRYVAAMHRKLDDSEVTEDDINEVKNDISTMRYELIEVFAKNGMDVSNVSRKEKTVLAKRMKIWERRLMKDFHVAPVELEDLDEDQEHEVEKPLARFKRVAQRVAAETAAGRWSEVLHRAGIEPGTQIGRCRNRDSFRNQQNLQKAMAEARRLVMRSPLPESRSCSPIEFEDPANSTLLQLLKNIEEEVREYSPSGTAIMSRRGTASPMATLGVQLHEAISKLSKTPSPNPMFKRDGGRSPKQSNSTYGTLLTSPPETRGRLSPMNGVRSPSPKSSPTEETKTPESVKSPPRVQSPPPVINVMTPSATMKLVKKQQSEENLDEYVKDSKNSPPKVFKRKAPVPVDNISISRPASKPAGSGQGMIPPPPAKAAEEQPNSTGLVIPTVSTIPPTPLPERKPEGDTQSATLTERNECGDQKSEAESDRHESPRLTMGVGVTQSTSSNSMERLVATSPDIEMGNQLNSNLRPNRKIEDVTTIKRKAKSGWL